MPEQADDHYNNGNEKEEKRDAVHAMHEFDVNIPRFFGISFPEVEISLYLFPDAHKYPAGLF